MNWWGYGALLSLWYLREYLWFVLLSPGALWLFRRWPLPTLIAPFVILVATKTGLPSIPLVNDLVANRPSGPKSWPAGRVNGRIDARHAIDARTRRRG